MNKILKITFVLFLSLTFFACSEDEVGVTEDKIELSAQDIAKYHNIAVGLYESSKSNNKGEKLNILEIQQSVTDLMNKNYPDLMKNFTIPQKANFLNSNYVMKSSEYTDFDFNSFLIDGLNVMVSENEISQNFSTEIMNLTTSDISFSNKLGQIEKLRNGNISADENNFLDVYESTLSASNEYWNTSNSNAAKAARLNCSSQVIAADAVGAALGLFGSPLWSIIQGAVVSIAVSEDCQD